MIRKGSKIVYPVHGAGKVVDIYKSEFNDERVDFYKIEFINSPVILSLPVSKSEELGLRDISPKATAKKTLSGLDKRVRVTPDTLRSLDAVVKEKMATGALTDAVEVISLLRSVEKKSREVGKSLSHTQSRNLESMVDFVSSEVEVVLGKKAVEQYDLVSD